MQCRRPGFDSWVGKIPWRRKWQPTPVSLPGESHGQRSLAGYSLWGRKSQTRLSTQHTQNANCPLILIHLFSFSLKVIITRNSWYFWFGFMVLLHMPPTIYYLSIILLLFCINRIIYFNYFWFDINSTFWESIILMHPDLFHFLNCFKSNILWYDYTIT